MRTASYTQGGIPTNQSDFDSPRLFDGVNLYIFDNDSELSEYISSTATPGSTASTPSGAIQTMTVVIDATPDIISTGVKGKKFIENDSKVIEWYLIGGQTGSIQFDVSRSSFENYSNTTSIVNGFTPSLTSQIKNSQTDITTWGTVSSGDLLELSVNSNTDISKISMILKLQEINT